MLGVGEGARVVVGGIVAGAGVRGKVATGIGVGGKDRVEMVGVVGCWAIIGQAVQAGKVTRAKISETNDLTIIGDVLPRDYPFRRFLPIGKW